MLDNTLSIRPISHVCGFLKRPHITSRQYVHCIESAISPLKYVGRLSQTQDRKNVKRLLTLQINYVCSYHRDIGNEANMKKLL